MMTFLAPPARWAEAAGTVVNTPVLSTTYSAPALAQGMDFGSLSENTVIGFPLTLSFQHLVW